MEAIVKKDDQKVGFEAVPGHTLGDMDLINRVMRTLLDHYPGYTWRAGVHDEPTGGVLYIMNMDINAELFGGQNYGYVLYLSNVYSDPGLRCVIMAAGEILERARLVRGRYKGEEITFVEGIKLQHQPRIISRRG